MISPKVDRHKSQPHDASTVHCEGYILRLVEILWNFARLKCVDRAQDDEKDVVEEGDDGRHLAGSALKYQGVLLMHDMNNIRFLESQPRESSSHLMGIDRIRLNKYAECR